MHTFQDQEFETWKSEAISKAINIHNNIEEINVHIVIGLDRIDNIYNAHALEFDIIAEGKTKNKALKELLNAVLSHISFCIAYDNKDKIVLPAPDEYWKDFYAKLLNGHVDKFKAPKLNKDTQLPFRPSKIGQLQVAAC
jgi:hypothetical protein